MPNSIAGVILAGGRSSRMGNDKSFIALQGKTLIQRCLQRASAQVSPVVISASEPISRFDGLGCTVVADEIPDYAGPLAGLLAAMKYFATLEENITQVASFPVDSPFFPRDLVARLHTATQDQTADIAIPCYQGRAHWVFGVWSIGLSDELETYLRRGNRSVNEWVVRQQHCLVDCAANEDPFFNINTPEDLQFASRLLE